MTQGEPGYNARAGQTIKHAALRHGAPDQLLARFFVRPLVDTPVTPNHLTTVRLLLGLGACVAFAMSGQRGAAIGGILFLLSNLMDHADGELARLSGKTSRFGHLYDLWADAAVHILLFVAIGFGLRDSWIGWWAPPLGIIAGCAIAALFSLCQTLERRLGEKQGGVPKLGRLDMEDVLYLVGPIVWLGGLAPLLIAAAIGAPLFLLWLFWHHRGTLLARKPS
jgi:phosphatidylglycerophosphate synthase